MDPTTAEYFRAILYRDAKCQTALPETLVELYAWTQKRHLSLNLGSIITKPVAISIVLTWLTTPEGRVFAQTMTIGHLFPVDADVDWEEVKAGSPVEAIDDKLKQTVCGSFEGKSGSWIRVKVAKPDGSGSEIRKFRTRFVKLTLNEEPVSG